MKRPKPSGSKRRLLSRATKASRKPAKRSATGEADELRRALDATATVLRIISRSRSQTDVQPVFDAIVQNAVTFCNATWGALFRFDGRLQTFAAGYNVTARELEVLRREFPRPLTRDRATGRAIADRRVVHIADIQGDPEYASAPLRAAGFRSVLAIPMVRDGEPLGVIGLWRQEVEPFTEKQIELVETLADQAVIAIENARLFTELQQKNEALTQAHAQVSDALEQQTATSEILKVISSSPTDVQPVFDAIADAAARLFHTEQAGVFRFDGELLHVGALRGWSPENDARFRERFPTRPEPMLPLGRCIVERAVQHVTDAFEHPDPRYLEIARLRSFRSLLHVPMMRGGDVVGSISVSRAEPGGFSPTEIGLLKTFADQAVIAIENVRLFTELQTSNRELTTALDTQTATADILRVISRAQTDVQPVFDAIVQSAARLLGAYSGSLSLIVGDQLELRALTGTDDAGDAVMRAAFPQMLPSQNPHALAIGARAPLNILDVETDPRSSESLRAIARARGYRSMAAVPLLLHGEPAGAIGVSRRAPGGFTAEEIALLQTFADQAVIAIENARLLSELQDRNEALTQAHAQVTEALEQQTATAEILRVISSSPTDYQPVFDTIVRNAAQICGAIDASLLLATTDRSDLVVRAHHGPIPGAVGERRPLQDTLVGRVVREARVVHVENLAESDMFSVGREYARAAGVKTALGVPLLREGLAIGLIIIRRLEVRPFTDKQIALLETFADQAVIAIENVRLFTELQTSNRDLTTALDTQTATSDILRVISRSQTDVQPVFDAIVNSAVRLLTAYNSALTRVDGDRIVLAAVTDTSDAANAAFREMFPLLLSDPGRHARAIRDRTPINVVDAQTDPIVEERRRIHAGVLGYRSLVIVPLLRRHEAIGTIAVARREPGGFTDDEIALLQTFADQAVIAIENARLLTELQARNEALTTAHAQVSEALEQQTATSEILRVISSSPTDVQPVFATVLASAARLCEASDATMFRVEGDELHLVAHDGPIPAHTPGRFPLVRGTPPGRVVLDRRPVHIVDLQAEIDEFPEGSAFARLLGFRAILGVPLLRGAEAVGAITIRRAESRPFTDRQRKLLQTFADQAVIAIENVRLFTELQTSNRELTTALDTQTATSEILRVISRTQRDPQPVFETIVRNALQLCAASQAGAYRFDGELIHAVANAGYTPEQLAHWRSTFPRTLATGSTLARAIVKRAPDLIRDVETEGSLNPELLANMRARGSRSVLTVPMMREGEVIGLISLAHRDVNGFSDAQVELLKTFADQAVIAIENARLLSELQERNEALTQAHAKVTAALNRQTATSDILRVISQSRTDVQPVFDAILTSAVRLLGAFSGLVTRLVGDQIVIGALTGSDDPAVDAGLRAFFPHPLQSGGTHARAMRDRAPINISDIQTDERVHETNRAYARSVGYHSQIVVPMLRDGAAIGAVAVTRRARGGFTDDEIAVLNTFADQAVIAIENVRLFTELQARTHELTRSVDQLTALGDVGRAVSSSLDLDTVLTTIVERAVQLSGTDGGTIFEYDEGAEEFTARATTINVDERQAAILRASRLRRGEGAVGQMAVTREPVQIADIAAEAAYESRLRGAMLAAGTRSVLAVPLLHEDRLVGGLVVTRRMPGAFTDDVVELLKTFATQSALAIQNARLFREIEQKSRELEVASQHKSEFLASMSHELRTPLNAIIGFSDVLLQGMFGETNEKQAEYLRDILSSGQHLLSLINDILDLSKIEAGRMELDLAEFDLPAAIDDALLLMRERAGRRGIALERQVDERIGPIRADQRKVKQVLLNLLSNAVKFTPEGGRIDVRAALANGTAEISVTDTGVGIAPEDHEAVFEEFRQVGKAEKKAEGTGLGLALCRKFVELHGGRIWVKSQLGAGSTFTFSLPTRVTRRA